MMASGQQKRSTSSYLHEQYKGRKKIKLDSSDYMLSLNSHIDLKWDECLKKVVAKEEQVGITWTYLAPFIDSVPKSRSGLADVINVPRDIFGMENLNEVLSYEVWATCLSESERKFLSQFLPGGTGAEQIVDLLLKGENHHFGNRYLKWSTSLCSGNLHPDVVLRMERQHRTNKKAHYVELNEYHIDMLEILKSWKEKWFRCKDPEKLLRGGPAKQSLRSLKRPAEKVKASKATSREMTQKIIHNNDISKYMSCIKISRTQHDIVKNMKQTGDGIPSELLSPVLGDIGNLQKQSYETFMEEEKNTLHKKWVQVSCKDVPAAYEDRRKQRLVIEQYVLKPLKIKFAEKKLCILEEDEQPEKAESTPEELVQESEHNYTPHVQHAENHASVSPANQSFCAIENISLVTSNKEPSPVVVAHEAAGVVTLADDSASCPGLLLGKQEPGNDKWQAVNNQKTCYHPQENHICTDSGNLSLKLHHLPKEPPTSGIDLESDIVDQATLATVTPTALMDNGQPFFCSYPNHDNNGLLPHFSKAPGTISSLSDQHMNGSMKQPFAVGFQSFLPNECLSEPAQFQHPTINVEKAFHMQQQSMNKNVYPGGGYPSQGHFQAVGQHNFTAAHPTINGSYNWFSEVRRAHNRWPGIEPAANAPHSLPEGSSVDGSLFSVLTECSNKASSGLQYDGMSPDQYMGARNFIPRTENIYAYQNQPNSTSNHVPAVDQALNSMPWTNFPLQNSASPDSMPVPFWRPRNRQHIP